MSNFTIVLLVLLKILLYSTQCVSDKTYLRKCVDLECKEKISLGRTTQRYVSRNKGILSFGANTVVTIYSKEDGPNSDLLMVEADGYRGHAPMKFVREERVFVADKDLVEIPQIINDKDPPKNDKDRTEIEPETSEVKDIPVLKEDVGKLDSPTIEPASELNINNQEGTKNSLKEQTSSHAGVPSVVQGSESASIMESNSELDNNEKPALKFEQDSKAGDAVDVNPAVIGDEKEGLEETTNDDYNDDENEDDDGSDDDEEIDGDEIDDDEEEEHQTESENDNDRKHKNIEDEDVSAQSKDKDSLHVESPINFDGPPKLDNGYRAEPSESVDILNSQKFDTSTTHVEQTVSTAEPLLHADDIKLSLDENKNFNMDGVHKPVDKLHQGNNVETYINQEIPVTKESESVEMTTNFNSEKHSTDVDQTIPSGEPPVNADQLKLDQAKNVETYINLEIPVSELSKSVETGVNSDIEKDNVADVKISQNIDGEMKTDSLNINDIQTTSEVLTDSAIKGANEESYTVSPTLQSDYEVVDGTTLYDSDYTQSYSTDIHSIGTTENSLESSQYSTQENEGTTVPTPTTDLNIAGNTERPHIERNSLLSNFGGNTGGELKAKINYINDGMDHVAIENNEKSVLNANEDYVLQQPTDPEDENQDLNDIPIMEGNEAQILNVSEDDSKSDTDKSNGDNEDFDFAPPKDESILPSIEPDPLDLPFTDGNDPKAEEGLLTSMFSSAMNLIKPASKIEDGDQEVVDAVDILDENHTSKSEVDIDDPLNSDGIVINDDVISDGKDGLVDNQETVEPSTPDELPKPLDSSQNKNITGENLIESFSFINPEDVDTTESSFSHEGRHVKRKNIDGEINKSSNTSEEQSITDMLWYIPTRVFEMTAIMYSDGTSFGLESVIYGNNGSQPIFILIIVIASSICIIYCAHVFGTKMSREEPLLQLSNDLDRKIRIMSQENIALKRRLTDTNGIVPGTHIRRSSLNDEEISKFREELETARVEYSEQENNMNEKVKQLEQELEDSTSSAMEMHKMLDELLSSQKEDHNFKASVDYLQSMLDSQREKVESLTSNLSMEKSMNDQLRKDLNSAKDRASTLDEQVIQLTKSLKEVSELNDSNLTKQNEDNRIILSLKEETEVLSKDYKSSSSSVENLKFDNKKLKDTLKKFEEKLGLNEMQLKLKSQLLHLEKVMQSLKTQLENSESSKEEVVDELKSETDKYEKLNSRYTKALKESEDSKANLEVLKNYFDQKEAELRKELLSQEDLKMLTQSSVEEVANQIQSYQTEINAYKSLNDSLKKEIEDQTESHKSLLKEEEKKSHESWLLARQAERRQDELRQENKVLRQRVTMIGREPMMHDGMVKMEPKYQISNGSISSPGSDGIPQSPPPFHPDMPPPLPPIPFPSDMHHPGMMLPPPPCPPFMMGHGHGPIPGLPPLPPFMQNHMGPHPNERIPPAGRIASPPYDRAFSPEAESDNSHYSDHYSPKEIRNMARYSPSGARSRYDGQIESRQHKNRMGNRRDHPSPSKDISHRPPERYRRDRSPDYFYHEDDGYRKSQITGSAKASTPGSTDR